MATPSIPEERQLARIAIVEKHIGLENEHDLEGVLGPSVPLHGTMMSRGASTIAAVTGSVSFMSS